MLCGVQFFENWSIIFLLQKINPMKKIYGDTSLIRTLSLWWALYRMVLVAYLHITTQGEVFSEWMTFEPIIGEESAEVGMVGKEYSKHVPHLQHAYSPHHKVNEKNRKSSVLLFLASWQHWIEESQSPLVSVHQHKSWLLSENCMWYWADYTPTTYTRGELSNLKVYGKAGCFFFKGVHMSNSSMYRIF